MKTENILIKIFLVAYLIIFFGYLLGPLVVMSITAFNSPSFPKNDTMGMSNLSMV